MESRNKLTTCRLCLCESECFINVFELNDGQGYVAAEIISDLLQLHVSETDCYPHVVCSKCIEKLTDFKLFKECCLNSKVKYDNMFASSESQEDHQPEMPVIKEEEVDISGDEYEEPFDGTNTEQDFGPILFENEVMTIYSGSQQQEELIKSEEFENVGSIGPSATSVKDSTLVELTVMERVAHLKYPQCLENERPHCTSKGEIDADSYNWNTSTNDESIFEKSNNISLSEKVEASSSGVMERLELQRIIPEERVYIAPLLQQDINIRSEVEMGKVEDDMAGVKKGWKSTGPEMGLREREGLKCFHCGIVLMSKLDLVQHIKVHGFVNSYKCGVCGKVLDRYFDFKNHILTHTSSKLYKCEECSKCFNRNCNLKVHMRTHTGDKPFKCAECSKCFSQPSALKMHMRIHTGSKPYKCVHCTKSFIRNYLLKVHMMSHTGSKPYKCAECTKSFSTNYNLTKHMRIHTGCKGYTCEECCKQFGDIRNLRNHMRLHTANKPYTCSE